MYRTRRQHESQEHESLDRWLVSYADYMTLMFALFVVLYAMAIVKEEEYTVLSETLGKVFEATPTDGLGVKGEGLLTKNTPVDTEFELYGTSLLEEKGPELLEDDVQLSEVIEKKQGRPLASLEEALQDALFDLVENGYAEVERSEDWLTIEINSRLMFVGGSAAPTKSAQLVMQTVYDIIGSVDNYIRVRGYTDDRPIQTEIYPSNWELSVARAITSLRILQSLGVNPARMAIEGYGQYSPFADNIDAKGRAENRKVVVALSKYALNVPIASKANTIKVSELTADDSQKTDYDEVQVIKLPSGGIRITTRRDNSLEAKPQAGKEQTDIDNKND
ncbi:MAG: chemotaxis protein MotB [Phenylobacterium sp.]|jgi:chemotaxis protein MotB